MLTLLLAGSGQSVEAEELKPRETDAALGQTAAQSEETRGENKIPQLADLDQAATTVGEWMEQIAQAAIVSITRVQLNPTDAGVEIVLETAAGQLAEPSTSTVGNALIADIPNATIAEEFSQATPIEGIALVSVTNRGENGVRVAITGTEAPPVAEVRSIAQNLVVSVTLGEPGQVAGEDAIQVVVTGEQDEGYNPSTATTGTRTDTPLRDIPFSIQVISQQVLEDQQVQRVSDALRNTPGVQPEESPRSIFENYRIRGFGDFSNFNNILVNGIRDGGEGYGVGVANIERIEVLRGPAGALFSQGGPGGTINIVTKQPLDTPLYSLEASYGNFDTYIGSLDFTGPLDQQGNVLYRLNAYGFSSDTFVDSFDILRYSVAPVIAVRLGENTTLAFEGDYTVFEQPNDRGLPARGTVLPNRNGELPLSRYLGEPAIDNVTIRTTRIGYRLEHEFSDNWQIRNNFRFFSAQQPQDSLSYSLLQDDDRTLERSVLSSPDQQVTAYSFNADVVGNFNTGRIAHTVLLGFDFLSQDVSPGEFIERSLSPIDIFDPDYGRENVGPVTNRFFVSPTITNLYGLYLQDQITLLDNLKLLLGGRFDWVDQRLENEDGNTTSSQSDSAFSPRIGVVYQPIEPLSLYASYSRSFLQTVGRGLDNQLFDPQRGTQYEVGVKADIRDNLAATLAFFDITRTNVLTENPDDPNFSIQTGEQNSRGIEFDINGEILPGWNIIAGYAYTDARITEDNTFEEGNRINNAPEHAASLWSTYQIQSGSLAGLGFGLGLFYVGDREGDLSNTFSLPSYLRTDASVFYERDAFRAAINIRNLFDIRYFETAGGELNVYPGEPFNSTNTDRYSGRQH